MLGRIKEDIKAAKDRDPAAKGALEIILCYPGLHALWFHRLAYYLYTKNLFVIARIVSHVSRFFTGVEIHPGAMPGHTVIIFLGHVSVQSAIAES